MNGTDVASYQTGMGYEAAKQSGIDFCIVKATDGGGYINERFHAQVNHAYAAKMLIGYYHFWRQQVGDKAQAAHFWNTVRVLWEPGERLALDVEQPSDDPTPLPPDTGERVYAMALEVERLSGVTPDLYMDRDTQRRFFTDPKFARFGLWLAAWQATRPPTPAPWSAITIWQNSGGQTIPGIGWADGDVFDGTAEDWKGAPVAPPFAHAPGFVGPPLIDTMNWGGDTAGIVTRRVTEVYNDQSKRAYRLTWTPEARTIEDITPPG